MEPLLHDDPRLVGPYTVLARYRESASAVRYLAYGANGGTAVVSVARPALAALPAFQRRFQAEARTAERLAGGWVQPLLDSRTDASEDGMLWTACDYVPALTLGDAVAVAGPLPERAVRILGAGLAETLSRVHATGAVLHGLAPDTVALAADGPRLTAFGALGAAVSAEAAEGGRLSVRLGYLTPEQLDGEEPGPPSDIFVLGLLLAYAATGTTPLAEGPPDAAADRIAHGTAELDGVPEELRPVVARCLAKEPGERPTAGAVAAELALEGASAAANATPDGWLPAALSTSITEQATRVDALHTPLDGTGDGGAEGTADGAANAHGGAGAAADAHSPVNGAANAPSRTDRPADPHDTTGSAADAHSPADRLADPHDTTDGPADVHSRADGAANAPGPADRPAGPYDATGGTADVHSPTNRAANAPSPRDRPTDPHDTTGSAADVHSPTNRTANAPSPTDRPADPHDATNSAAEAQRPADGPADAVPGAASGAGHGATGGAPVPPDTRTTRIGPPRAASGSEGGVVDRPTAALSLPRARPEPPAFPLPPATAPVPQQSQPFPPGPLALPPGAPAAPTGSGSGRFDALRKPLGQLLARRTLVTGIAAGVAGLVIGGGGVLAFAGDDDAPSDDTDSKPGGDDTPKGLTGLPPEALWAYEHKVAADEVLTAAVIGARCLVVATATGATGVDVRTGKRLWRNADAAAVHQPLPASGGLAFLAGATGLLWISTASGAVKHRVDYADGIRDAPGLTVAGIAGTGDGQVWFTGSHKTGTGKAAKVSTYLFAYDLTTRKELWRTAISNGRAPLTPVYQLIAVREADIVVRQDAKSLLPAQVKTGKGKSVYHCFSRVDGKRTWSKSFGAVPPTGGSVGDAQGRLYAAATDQLYAYDTADAKQVWRRAGAPRVPGQNSFAFGTGTLVGSTLYVANRFQEVYALDPDSGLERWKSTTEGPAWNAVPRITLSESGETVLSADGLQVTAFGAVDGKRLWKFQSAGGPAPSPDADDDAAVPAPAYQPLMAGRTAVIRRGGTFYALPVD